jgi:hypothetical protein
VVSPPFFLLAYIKRAKKISPGHDVKLTIYTHNVCSQEKGLLNTPS